MARSAPLFALDLDVGDDDGSGALSAAVVQALVDGQLADGDRLPSTRVLAEALGVPRARVVEAYLQLTASGFVVTVAGSGTRVEQGASAAVRAEGAARFSAAVQIDTESGVPGKVRFDREVGPEPGGTL